MVQNCHLKTYYCSCI